MLGWVGGCGASPARAASECAADRRARRPGEVRAQIAAIGFEHGLRDRAEQRALGLADGVAAQQEGAARLMLPRAPRSLVQERGEPRLDFVEVADRMLVEDHDIGPQSLEAPVLLRFERLTHEP